MIDALLAKAAIIPAFCEFGFDISEFNCSRLALRGFEGLLIDGNGERVRTANRILSRNNRIRTVARNAFLDLSNIGSIVGERFPRGALGVLSIDVDGNDYWFLQELLTLSPQLIVVEYNASFGLRPITVPYDPSFDRHAKHASGWYHGASITALYQLATKHDYGFVGISDDGLNLFFLAATLIPSGLQLLTPKEAFRENALRNRWSGTKVAQQWEQIRDLPFVTV